MSLDTSKYFHPQGIAELCARDRSYLNPIFDQLNEKISTFISTWSASVL
ncbi:MAG: hypothetical protein ACKPEQ_09455 [Dolichospermum sp.]